MNAAFLLLSSACVAGAEGVPVPVPVAAPIVVAAPVVGGCAGCASGDPCGAGFAPGCQDPNPNAKRVGLFSKIKSRISKPAASGHAPSCDLGCSTGCGAPAHVVHAAPVYAAPVASYEQACDPCGKAKRVGLLARIKARLCGKGCDDCAPSCAATTVATCGCGDGGCALPLAPGAVTPAAPDVAPKEMEKPKTPPKTTPTVGSLSPTGVVPVAGASAPF